MKRILAGCLMLAAVCAPPPEPVTGDRIMSAATRIAGDWVTSSPDSSAAVSLELAVSGGYIFSMHYMDVNFFIDQGICMVRRDSLQFNSMKKNLVYKTAYRTDGDTLRLDLQSVFTHGYDAEVPAEFFMKSAPGALQAFIRQ